MSDNLPAPPPPAMVPAESLPAGHASLDFQGHKGIPLAPIRWPIPLLFALVISVVAFVFGSSWFAYRSGIMHGLSADMRSIVLVAVIFVQYLAPLVFVARWAAKRGAGLRDTFSLRPFDLWTGIGMAVAFSFAARMLGMEYAAILTNLGVKAPNTVDVTRLFPFSPIGVIATVLVAVVIAPLAEEALFRGVIFAGLRDRWGQVAGMLVSAGVFALVHFSWYQFVPIFLLGMMLAWLTSSTRSIWPSIACHAMFNGSAVAILYVLRAFGVGA